MEVKVKRTGQRRRPCFRWLRKRTRAIKMITGDAKIVITTLQSDLGQRLGKHWKAKYDNEIA